MGLIKRGNSKNWYVQFMHDGKNHIRSAKTTNKREAAKVEQQMREDLFKTNVLGEADSITIRAAVELYVDTFKDRPESHSKAIHMQTFVFENLEPDRNLESLSSRDIEKVKNIRLRRGNKNATINLTFNFIRMFHKNAKRLGYATQILEFPKIRADKHKLRYLTLDEEKALLKALQPTHDQQKAAQQDNYDLVVTLLDTGARHGEIVRLTWEDIDMKAKTVKLYRPKVRNQSVIYMSDRLYAILSRRSASSKSKYVFTSRDGGPRNHSTIAIKKAIKRANLEDVSIHTLRHTAASRWIQHGLSLFEVSQMLGHSDIKTTMRYAHLEQTDTSLKARDVLNKIHEEEKPKLKVVC